MTEESEKRFHAVMDKLFLSPSSTNSNTKSTRTPPSISAIAGELSRGKKHLYNMTTTLALVESKSKENTIADLRNTSGGRVQSPVCRPWNREDLLKRLATFKSMTWFAKPEVVSAINCATRGWINVDADIIACESCGARLFFSTPSSWAQQQVENAASVFNLKLNNGHKLLCPWVDNACDEKLAHFPPTSRADLVDNYKKRRDLLLKLLELPVISSTAINYINTPLLDHFLKCPPTLDESEESSSVSYYQAQKLISLCGWEARLLPYIVDCKHVQNADFNANITLYSSRATEYMETNEEFSTENEQYDHTSVVLGCKLCGATVGLWAFNTTQRPAEFIRLIGHAEITENNQIPETSNTENGEQLAVGGPASTNRNVLNLTIAGGPPPAEQNFQPTISLPVVGQNLRTRFSSAFGSVDGDHSNDSVGDENSIMKTAISGSDKPCPVNLVAKQSLTAKSMEFDPIKQHRHFCPWIASNGKAPPGWKQTLSALQRLKEFVYPSDTTQVLSLPIQVEDPVGSVKKLFTPPSAKRKKFTHGLS